MAPKSPYGSDLRRSARLRSRGSGRSARLQLRGMKELEGLSVGRVTEKKKKTKTKTMKIYITSGHVEILPKESMLDYDKPYELDVDPQLKVKEFVKQIQPLRWIPKNTKIVTQDCSPPRALKYNSTLAECGVKDGDLLLACKAGGFSLGVLSNSFRRLIGVRVNSCFDTIGDVKELIYKACRRHPEKQVITTLCGNYSLPDDTTLVSLAIVRPYHTDMKRTISLRVVFLE